MTDISRDLVLARWAYSELTSIDHGRKYDRPGIAELRAKLRQGIPFDDLQHDECDLLLAGWQQVRGTGTVFGHFLNGVSTFEIQHWSREELAAVHVISNFTREVVSDSLRDRIRLPFQLWIEAEPVRPLHQGNPRYAAIGATSPWTQADPITAGRYPDDRTLLLLDGYHRAVRFWAQSDPDIKLAAYVAK